MSDFGELLKRLREGANLTQKQLGEKLHLSKSVIYYYEHSMRAPSADILMQIADVFHVSVDYLLGREKKEQTLDLSDLPNKDIEFVQAFVLFLLRKNEEQVQKEKEEQEQKEKEEREQKKRDEQNQKEKEDREQKKNEEHDKDPTANC